MHRPPPSTTRHYTLFPYTALLLYPQESPTRERLQTIRGRHEPAAALIGGDPARRRRELLRMQRQNCALYDGNGRQGNLRGGSSPNGLLLGSVGTTLRNRPRIGPPQDNPTRIGVRKMRGGPACAHIRDLDRKSVM